MASSREYQRFALRERPPPRPAPGAAPRPRLRLTQRQLAGMTPEEVAEAAAKGDLRAQLLSACLGARGPCQPHADPEDES
jgi:hypothetical protein